MIYWFILGIKTWWIGVGPKLLGPATEDVYLNISEQKTHRSQHTFFHTAWDIFKWRRPQHIQVILFVRVLCPVSMTFSPWLESSPDNCCAGESKRAAEYHQLLNFRGKKGKVSQIIMRVYGISFQSSMAIQDSCWLRRSLLATRQGSSSWKILGLGNDIGHLASFFRNQQVREVLN